MLESEAKKDPGAARTRPRPAEPYACQSSEVPPRSCVRLALVACEKQPPPPPPAPPAPAAARCPRLLRLRRPLWPGRLVDGPCRGGEGPLGHPQDQQGRHRGEALHQGRPEDGGQLRRPRHGEKEWTDPRDGQQKKTPLYDGTEFHRVIPDFMIQGGDPDRHRPGTPGFTFEDEFQSGRKFDKKGILAMANRGPEHQRQPVLHHHLDTASTSTASTPSSARWSRVTRWWRPSPR